VYSYLKFSYEVRERQRRHEEWLARQSQRHRRKRRAALGALLATVSAARRALALRLSA
jgi:hypothetical protein